jgi:hypothetical protein
MNPRSCFPKQEPWVLMTISWAYFHFKEDAGDTFEWARVECKRRYIVDW